MTTDAWIFMSLGVGIALVAAYYYFQRRMGSDKKLEADYKTMYHMGLLWTIIGVPLYFSTDNFGFLAMGIVFLVFSISNKDKWEQHKPISRKKRSMLITFAVLLAFLVILTALYGS
jgi:multisubunit Na+/H+ antiporter MnhB subunit